MTETRIMGILNVTPDSFSDGGLYLETEKALARAKEMIEEGADIVDVGGESTRPGSEPISVKEELARVLPIVKAIKKETGKETVVSIDTYKSAVAKACFEGGANMINSLGGFTFDADLAKVVAEHDCKIVLYHIKGQPKTMQAAPVYQDVVAEIKEFFEAQITYGVKNGIERSRFILDPGIGFGKTLEHNLEIIKRFEEFKSFGLPLMVGVSRKSHLGLILKEALGLKEIPKPEERVEAGLAEVAMAVLKGASIVRTHDVLATKKFLAVLDKLK